VVLGGFVQIETDPNRVAAAINISNMAKLDVVWSEWSRCDALTCRGPVWRIRTGLQCWGESNESSEKSAFDRTIRKLFCWWWWSCRSRQRFFDCLKVSSKVEVVVSLLLLVVVVA